MSNLILAMRAAHHIRTLHILTSLERRGAETFAVQLIDRLSRGVFKPAIWTIEPYESQRYLIPSRTPVFALRAGKSILPLAVRRLRHLLGVCQEYQPHIIHCHGGRGLKYVIPMKAIWAAQAYVYTKIGSVHPWLDPVPKRLFYGALFERLNAIVAVGEQIRREVEVTFHPRRPRLLTIYTGRDVAPFAAVTPDVARQMRAELALDDTDICLMTVGSLSWEKAPQLLLRLFARMVATDPRLKLVFVGEGPLQLELEADAVRDGLGERVRFLGVRRDVPRVLSAADIFVLPSVTEGLPGVLIEAGMAGLPAVAFRIGAVEEVLNDEETGFVAPPGNAEAFGERVLRLARDPGLRRRMGGEALIRCRRDFDIRRSVERHEALFLELLERSNQRAVARWRRSARVRSPSPAGPADGIGPARTQVRS
jgi:glycosyltransferase involved in cell wall biosynthesis